MLKQENNYAFIDSQNVHLSIKVQGWTLDWKRFRVFLRERYSVQKVYLFIGFIKGNEVLYNSLQEAGFEIVFKPTLEYRDKKTKGNCDADLVLKTMIEFNNFEKAVLVTGDGDFYCLVDYLILQKKLETVLVPNFHKYSALLKKFSGKLIAFMNELRNLLELKEKDPRETEL